MRVDELLLSVRTINCLKSAGIETVEQLIGADRRELRELPNFGKKSELEIAWSLVHLLSGGLAEQLERLDAMGYGSSQSARSEIMKKARNFDRIAAIVAGKN
jgi:DNA-directed RNA polymerase alpha subunit